MKGLMYIALGMLLAVTPLQALAECYMDTPSGYGSIGGSSRIGPYPNRVSCESVNSQSFRGRGSCSCTSSSTSQGATGSSSNPYMSTDQMMLNTMQGLMNNFMSGYQQGLEQNRQRAILQQQENQRRQRAMQAERLEWDRLYKEKEKRHRQQFQEAKERMLGQMRDVESLSPKPRNLSSLEVRETEGAFGIKTLKPRDLSKSTQLSPEAPDSHGWLKKVNCSAYLLRKALENWTQKKFEEAAYLSNEAAALASGEKSSPSLVCPPLPDVADIKGEQTPQDKAKAEKFMKRTLLVSKLFTQAARQMKNYKALQESGRKARQKVDEARVRVEEDRVKKQGIEREQQQVADAKKADIMAKALAALQKSKEALALSEKHLADVRGKQEGMENSMKQTRDMFNAAQKNPDKTDDFLDQLSKEK